MYGTMSFHLEYSAARLVFDENSSSVKFFAYLFQGWMRIAKPNICDFELGPWSDEDVTVAE